MTSVLRRYQQQLMLITTILVIIAFVWLYNGTSPQFGAPPGEERFKVYDQTVYRWDLERRARGFQLAASLGLNELLMALTGNSFSQDQAVENYVWNSFVLERESERLGIFPTDHEVVVAIRGLPAFQTNGQFDPVRYQNLVQEVLMPNGFTESEINELVRNNLRVARLNTLIGGTVDVTPAEFEALYTQAYQENEVKVIRFDLETFAKAAEPTQEQIKAYQERHASALVTPEKRSVRFVELTLTSEEKGLAQKERVAALQKLADRTNEFIQALLKDGAEFDGVAKEFGLSVDKSEAFAISETPAGFEGFTGLGRAVFGLSKESPFSEALTGKDAYRVVALEEIVPSRPLTLEEARPKIVENLKREAGLNAMTSRVNEVRKQISEALLAGKTIEEAASGAGVTLTEFPTFSLAELPRENPLAGPIAQVVDEMRVGALSESVTLPDGAALVFLVKRLPVSKEKMAEAEKTQLGELRFFKQASAFQQWLLAKRKEARVHSLTPQEGQG